MLPQHTPQSFDDILSELAEDPAMPDPHKIRKSSAPQRPPPEGQAKPQSPSFSVPELRFDKLKTTPILMMRALFVLTIAAVFFSPRVQQN